MQIRHVLLVEAQLLARPLASDVLGLVLAAVQLRGLLVVAVHGVDDTRGSRAEAAVRIVLPALAIDEVTSDDLCSAATVIAR